MNHFRPNNFRTTEGKSDCRRAFTLIEILIVVALTAVLFTLMLIPLVSALNYTRQSQLLTAAQDAARITRETITRELGSALYVFDNTSHPFLIANDPNIPGEDRYTNFLDLQILDNKGNPVVAHAYNAKLDIVQPKLNDSGSPIDPTTQQPITYSQSQNGSAIISSPSLIFPAASGTTMTRYWTGLKDPTKSYNNTREGYIISPDDNTYILYRAQFPPYLPPDPTTGKAAAPNADGTTINEALFAPQGESDGAVTKTSTPEFDDPDFFRYVSSTDVNWLSADHHTYTQSEITTHNARVDKWIQIAKPVIPGPTVDLVLQPHYSNGKLSYDQSGPFTGVAHSGIAHDPIGNADYPIVNSSVTFRPGTVSGNATPATTSDYSSQGVISGMDQNGYTYVPTIYTTTNQSWVKPYVITLTPPAAPANSGQTVGGMTYTISQDPATNDYMEYTAPPNNGAPVAVFDVTKGLALPGATTGSGQTATTSYIPLTVNADTGTISFDVPAQPYPANVYDREWVYTPTMAPDGTFFVDLKTNDANNSAPQIDQTPQIGAVVDSAYPTYAVNSGANGPLYTARIVPGSLRVYGPDGTPGPGQGQPILYTETGNVSVPGNDPQKGDNRYYVDYAAGIIHFEGNASQLALVAPATTLPVPVKVIYDYQANMAPVGTIDTNKEMGAGYALLPMTVSVEYQTRDLVSLSLGVRIFDISTGVAQIIPSETKIKIGNSNR